MGWQTGLIGIFTNYAPKREWVNAVRLTYGMQKTGDQDARKSIDEIHFSTRVADARGEKAPRVAEQVAEYADEIEIEEALKILNAEIRQAAEALDFERAASLRDQIRELQEKQLQEN